jgi:phosphoadenosine phosphosulfate reductase
MTKTQEKYTMTYEIITPNKEAVSDLIKNKGEFSFYESIENRKECCYIRKVAPLKRVLTTADAWITGQRKAQSATRSDLAIIEWDDSNQKIKFNPLATWSSDHVWAYIKENQIPYNPLHNKGYPSIGCEPCTRAIKPDEDPRAGRWWWESVDQKECGLHLKS